MLPVLCIYQILVQPGLCASTTTYLSVPAVEIRGWMDFLLVASKNLLIQCALWHILSCKLLLQETPKSGGFACEGISNETSCHCVFLDPNKCVFMLTCYRLNIGEKSVM